MSSLPRRPTIVSVSSPSLKSNSVGIPRTAYRSGIVGFSSTFSLATVARPSNSVASASTVGASRRQGPHHSAQKSTSTMPLFFSSSKLLSVNVLTFSDAIRYLLELSPARSAFVHLNVLLRRRVPRKILTHSCLLDASPEGPVPIRGQRSSNCCEERLRRVLDESKPGAPARLRIDITNRVVETSCGPYDRNRSVSQAVHLIQAAWLESRRHQEDIRPALDQMCQLFVEPNACPDHRRVLGGLVAPQIFVPSITSAEHHEAGTELRQLISQRRYQVETFLIDHPRDHADQRPAPILCLRWQTVGLEQLALGGALPPQL